MRKKVKKYGREWRNEKVNEKIREESKGMKERTKV